MGKPQEQGEQATLSAHALLNAELQAFTKG